MNYINITEIPEGLKIELTDEGREYLADTQNDHTSIWLDFLEEYSTNGSYMWVHPEKVGAMTDSPIIGIDFDYDEEDEIQESENCRYWYFPDYMVKNEFEILLTEPLILTKAL